MNLNKASETQPCDCTKIAQHETCPIGFPSLLCDMCAGKGVVPYVKLDGPELWEIVFGVNSDAASELSDEDYRKIAEHIGEVFINPLRAEIEALRATINSTPLATENEAKVLEALSYGYDEYCYSFSTIEGRTSLTRKEVAAACRSLKDRGLARFVRSLMDFDEGKVAGAGYGITDDGMALLKTLHSGALGTINS